MKNMFPLVGVLTALPIMAAEPFQAPPQSNDNQNSATNSYRLSVKASNECLLLGDECKGHVKQLRFETPSGYFISIEKMADRAGVVAFDKSYKSQSAGHVHGRIAWEQKVTGAVGRIGKAFQWGEQTTVNVEAYAGNITGDIRLNALAEATAYPASITIPAFSYHNGQHHIEFPGKTFSIEETQKMSSQVAYARSGKTYFGGLKESIGIAFGPYKNTHLLVSQFGQAGLDRIDYGAGLGVAYTSSADSKIGQRASNICQGGDFRSSARYAFVFSACANKITKDSLYDKLAEKAEPLAAKIRGRMAEAQGAIDKVENRTGYGYDLGTYSGKDVLRGLGIESPYERINTSFVMAASMNFKSVTLTLTHQQPLQSSRHVGAVTSLTLGKEF